MGELTYEHIPYYDIIGDTMNDIIRNGQRAKLLLSNPIFMEVVQDMQKDLYEKWLATNFQDYNNREELYRLKISLELLVANINSRIIEAENVTNTNNNDE